MPLMEPADAGPAFSLGFGRRRVGIGISTVVTVVPWSPRCPQIDHPRSAVSAVILEGLHGAIHAIRVPVNPERRVPNTTSDTELIPRNDRRTIVTAGVEHNLRQPDLARKLHIFGLVKLSVTIAPNGSVKFDRSDRRKPAVDYGRARCCEELEIYRSPLETRVLIELRFNTP
jgi:hypothetical protein